MDFTEPSLAVLFLLQHAQVPMTLEQMSSAFDNSGYTYMHVAIVANKLLENNFVTKHTQPTGEFFEITVSGRLNLVRLETEIRYTLRQKLLKFCKENISQINMESNTSAYISTFNNVQQVILQAFDKEETMSQIVLNVADYDEAQLIAKNWKKHADEAIAAIYSVLLQDDKK